MIRWIRVLRNQERLTAEAWCRQCGELVFYLTDEELLWRRRSSRHGAPFDLPYIVEHACRKFTTKPLLHNGRKPRR